MHVGYPCCHHSVSAPVVQADNRQTQACRICASVVILFTEEVQSTLHITSFLFFSIGLNLHFRRLVMIHGIDGEKMEKYYVGGSLFLAILLGVIAYLSGQLIYIPSQNECYVRGVGWQIGLQQLWNVLAIIGELVTFSSIIMYLYSFKVFDPGPGRDTAPIESGLSASHHYRKPLGPKQYRNIVLRIALYPFSSLTTLGVMSIGTLSMIAKGLNDQSDWKLLLTLRLFYLARGTIYGVIAASDPAIAHGLKVLYRHYASTRPAAADDSHDLELQESTSPASQPAVASGLPQLELPDPRSSITLPPIPRPALLSSLIDAHYRSGYTTVDVGNGSRTGDGVGYPFSELRQFLYEVLDGTLSEVFGYDDISFLSTSYNVILSEFNDSKSMWAIHQQPQDFERTVLREAKEGRLMELKAVVVSETIREEAS
ncbi:hypothetical protein L218DRAFT_950763 [Marasmius fiardii PR-910]|nr:hypothetical protein L218DRAFT_950763 [Marasmius fiardii PR-910]